VEREGELACGIEPTLPKKRACSGKQASPKPTAPSTCGPKTDFLEGFHRTNALADFLNWMPSTETQDVGEAEEIQESAESAFATALQET
jgi:hypothetical protein